MEVPMVLNRQTIELAEALFGLLAGVLIRAFLENRCGPGNSRR